MNTQQIKIRSVSNADAEALQEIYTSDSAVKGLLQTPFRGIDFYKKRIESYSDNYYCLVACIENQVVGVIGLNHFQLSPRIRHAGDFHIAIKDDYCKKGIGSELMKAMLKLAFGYLNLHRLELMVFADNEPAINLYKKFGFEIEGRKRDFAFRDGKYIDAYIMSLISNPIKDKEDVHTEHCCTACGCKYMKIAQ